MAESERPRSRERLLLAGALALGLAVAAYVFVQDKEWGAELLRALFGLSGGTTAGGV